MKDFESILENVRRNEEIARKLFDLEVCILSITDFKSLVERLLFTIERKFQIPYVWLCLTPHPTILPFVQPLMESPLLRSRLTLVPLKNLLEVAGDDGEPVLADSRLEAFTPLYPPGQDWEIRSLALALITLDGDVIGSLNLGDADKSRFQPDMDTFFLSQLAVKVSLCLAGVLSHERLKALATRDPLTGLPNRRELEAQLQRECARARRYRHPLSVLFIDCDNFKQINDRYGHDAGDALLRHVGELLRRSIRAEDMVARFAGDEFVLLLPNQTSDDARKVVSRLQKTLEDHPLRYGKHTIRYSVSFGIATAATDPDPRSLLKDADAALYQTKRFKKNRNSPKEAGPGETSGNL